MNAHRSLGLWIPFQRLSKFYLESWRPWPGLRPTFPWRREGETAGEAVGLVARSPRSFPSTTARWVVGATLLPVCEVAGRGLRAWPSLHPRRPRPCPSRPRRLQHLAKPREAARLLQSCQLVPTIFTPFARQTDGRRAGQNSHSSPSALRERPPEESGMRSGRSQSGLPGALLSPYPPGPGRPRSHTSALGDLQPRRADG